MARPDTPDTESTATIPLVEERAVVGTRDTSETISVQTRILSETETVSAELLKEDVSVTRIPHNTVIETAPAIRTEGDTTIIPVVREELVLQKRLVLVEEIHLMKSAARETVTTEVELRRSVPEIVRTEG